ncbi:hypothetical protein [Nannocystis sp. SCPEA4]|uniref:hypothetical protein n=1 Tax=Nannocystis sp. SCPEA4 TaxID=2996787 RepID=UPI00226DB38A|nr:hypothetical protein [Nannocystis sp. SCPEA4]MCY1060652.1 hypothetical protein [Nannocystis sp. SCPEA4]
MLAPLSALVVASSLLAAAGDEPQAAATGGASPPSYMQPIYVDPPPGHYDPPPGYYDPPPAYYESDTPGGAPVYKDPPAGYYDPPPGWYDPPPGYYMPPAGLPAPLPIPREPVVLADDAWQKWAARHDTLRRRQIGWGITLGLSVLTLGMIAAFPPDDCRDCGPFARPILGISAVIMTKISLVSTIINGVALARHNRNRPAATLALGPGSLRVEF